MAGDSVSITVCAWPRRIFSGFGLFVRVQIAGRREGVRRKHTATGYGDCGHAGRSGDLHATRDAGNAGPARIDAFHAFDAGEPAAVALGQSRSGMVGNGGWNRPALLWNVDAVPA